MSEPLLQTQESRHDLQERLRSCEMVARLGPDEAGKLAQAFSDLENSFRTVLYKHFPGLADPSLRGEQLESLLLNIREEFRRISFRIEDQKFFRAMEPSHDWMALTKTAKK